MKALVLNTLNSKPVYTDHTLRELKSGEVVVDLHASALNHRDLWITKGMYPNIQVPVILGSDGAGMIGERRVLINPGWYWGADERVQSEEFTVLGMPTDGTFAEQVIVPSQYVYDIPVHLSIEEAAALPLAGVTAFRSLMVRCEAQKSDKILITGIGGGVAQFAMQFAIALGAEVYVTSGSDEKLAKAKGMGAAGGYNYKHEGWYKEAQKDTDGYDVIIDSAGGDSFQHYIKLSRPGARIGFYGATLGKYNNINPQIMFWRQVSVLGSTMGSDQDFEAMLEFVSEHKIHPLIDTVIPLSDGIQAFDRMEAGNQHGKIILKHI